MLKFNKFLLIYGLIEIPIILFLLVNSFFPNFYESIFENLFGLKFGTTNFPTSLDSLTNPSGTDSVATVSHSSQHANANDALEALEAKLGIGASTPTNGTVLIGNGVGTSAFSASPSLTSLILSGLGTFGSFISNASSTVVGNLNITGNATTTNATSTSFFATNANFTNLNGTNVNGYGLSPCVGGNFVQWSNGTFGCASPGSSVSVSTSTTEGTWYASTTVIGLSANKIFDINIYVGTTTAPGGVVIPDLGIVFNDSRLDNIYSCASTDGAVGACVTNNYGKLYGTTGYTPGYITLTIDNLTGHQRVGNFQIAEVTNFSNPSWTMNSITHGSIHWATTTPITSITVGLVGTGSYKISSTTIDVFQR